MDEQYPLGSAERQAYLAASGGVAPVGATVTIDFAGKHVSKQHGRTTADRRPNGFPATPGSPNYQTTTIAQREAQRTARWVAAMNASGINEWWLQGIPDDIDDILAAPYASRWGAETPEMVELRAYQSGGQSEGQVPPDHVVWSFARWYICGGWAHTKATDHANFGTNVTPCEPELNGAGVVGAAR